MKLAELWMILAASGATLLSGSAALSTDGATLLTGSTTLSIHGATLLTGSAAVSTDGAALSIGAAATSARDHDAASRPAHAPALPVSQESKPDSKADTQADARKLEASFQKQGIRLDLERHLCWIPVTIDVRDDLLEYLLVNPKGAAHESMLATDVVPSLLQTALLALGVEPGKNAAWKARTPAPTEEEMRAGIAPYTVDPPEGDGFFLYLAWREKGETFFYRVEDLLRDLETGRSMRRHRWVYLGSRWVRTRQESNDKSFMADLEGNLINIALFEEGNTLLTAGLLECLKQTVWLTNAWLLPARGAEVALIFARERLAALPPALEPQLPEVVPEPDANAGPKDGR